MFVASVDFDIKLYSGQDLRIDLLKDLIIFFDIVKFRYILQNPYNYKLKH